MSDGDSGRKLLYAPHIFIATDDSRCRAGASCCGDVDAAELLAYMKATAKQKGITGIRVNRSACLGRCEHGPVMVLYPEGVWYTYRSKEDLDEIIQTHLIEGGRVERLMIDPPAPAAGAGAGRNATA